MSNIKDGIKDDTGISLVFLNVMYYFKFLHTVLSSAKPTNSQSSVILKISLIILPSINH